MHGKVSASRIDMFLITNNCSRSVKNCDIGYGFRSDHSIINLEIEINDMKHGPGVWKLNNKLLLDNDYVTTTRTVLEEMDRIHSHEEPDIYWQSLKHNCINHSVRFLWVSTGCSAWRALGTAKTVTRVP